MSIKVHENKLRRLARRLGLRLNKSRMRKPDHDNQGGYRIMALESNVVVYGERYTLSLDDVSNILDVYGESV